VTGLSAVPDIAAAVAAELAAAGPGARVCVLPEGPQTIPFVTAEAPVPGEPVAPDGAVLAGGGDAP